MEISGGMITISEIRDDFFRKKTIETSDNSYVKKFEEGQDTLDLRYKLNKIQKQLTEIETQNKMILKKESYKEHNNYLMKQTFGNGICWEDDQTEDDTLFFKQETNVMNTPSPQSNKAEGI